MPRPICPLKSLQVTLAEILCDCLAGCTTDRDRYVYVLSHTRCLVPCKIKGRAGIPVILLWPSIALQARPSQQLEQKGQHSHAVQLTAVSQAYPSVVWAPTQPSSVPVVRQEPVSAASQSHVVRSLLLTVSDSNQVLLGSVDGLLAVQRVILVPVALVLFVCRISPSLLLWGPASKPPSFWSQTFMSCTAVQACLPVQMGVM